MEAAGPLAKNIGPERTEAIRLQLGPVSYTHLDVYKRQVQDSTTQGEWEEALWKARYVQGLVRRD